MKVLHSESQKSDCCALWWHHPTNSVLGLCVVLAVANSVVKAAAIWVLLSVCILLAGTITRWTSPLCVPRLHYLHRTLVAVMSVVAVHLFIVTYLPQLAQALGIYVPLIATSCVLANHLSPSPVEITPAKQVLTIFFDLLGLAVFVLVLAAVREWFAYGELLHDIGLLSDQPYLVSQVTPRGPLPILATPLGALLIAGLLLAVGQHLRVCHQRRRRR